MSAALASPEAGTPRLVVRACRKAFPGVQALDRVSIEIQPGEIHALLGENGAGKSTLGKIIGGVYHADEGEVELDGRLISSIDEAAAGELGIGIVHQEGSLVPQLSIAENIFAGRQPTGWLGTVDRSEMFRRTRALLDTLGVPLDPAAPVQSLSTAQAQVVEIAKALSRELRLLILDEPSSALTLTEVERLFDIVRNLKASGVSIIYVSHRLAEIFELCDRVTVLKDGRVTGTRVVAETTQDALIRLMVGREVVVSREALPAVAGRTVLEVDAVVAPPFVSSASFSVAAGEIVCLAGLVGSGRSEICEAVFGVRRVAAGTIRLNGKPVSWDGPWAAMAAGVGMVPEDRKEGGLFLNHSIASNRAAAVLPEISRFRRHLQHRLGSAGDPLHRRTAHQHAVAGSARRQSLGRQPAESASRQVARSRAAAADRRRADAGRRRRCPRGNLPHPAPAQGRRHGAPRRLVRSARSPGARRSRRGDGRWADGRRDGWRNGRRGGRFAPRDPPHFAWHHGSAGIPQLGSRLDDAVPAATMASACIASVPARALRRLANSRELTLLILIVVLGGAMTIVYPANFRPPTICRRFC